jgi:hypothetical protein
MESDSSAKAGSKAFSGKFASSVWALRMESRHDDRDDGLRGVVGLEFCAREFDRFRLIVAPPLDSSFLAAISYECDVLSYIGR